MFAARATHENFSLYAQLKFMQIELWLRRLVYILILS